MNTFRPLRILVVLPMYGGSLPVGRYVRAALESLGHQAYTFEAPQFYPAFTAFKDLGVASDRLDYLENSYLQLVGQAVMAKVEAMEPDLVLAMAQAPLSRQILKRLRKDGIATAMWFVEDYRVFTYWQAFAPLYDVFAVIQKEPFLSELAGLGQTNALYLPMAADPAFHCPMELTPAERRVWGSDVSFMGAGYPNRRVAFRRLLGRDFKIWGNEWDGDLVLEPYVQRGGMRIEPQDCVRIFNATKINLNLHSNIDPRKLVSGGDFVNPRTFELAACGAFQLVDRRELLSECFSSNELAVFENMDELMAHLDHYMAHPAERQAMATRARARVLAHHTYAQRMAALLSFMEQRLPDWPPQKEKTSASAVLSAGLPEGLPEDLAAQLDGLFDRLGLTAQVSFDDLIYAVRSQQGVLSPLDTTLLFLDEWRKQYRQ